MKTFNSGFDIYFEDLSASGKVHLEKIGEWMSMTREQYFKSSCPDHLKFVESPIQMFTMGLSITVTGTCRWADKIQAILTTANIKKISFEMHIDFKNERTGNVIAKGVQKVAFVDVIAKKFTNIPDNMKQVIVNFTNL
ncbi:MAG: hypothetical protein WDL87_05710 [Candidatus Omnitrophota bacterium]|jgi:acyl-CoA thioesterase FadM